MTVDFDFSWLHYLRILLIFVGVPTAIGAGIIWAVLRSERAGRWHSPSRQGWAAMGTSGGRLGPWATGLVAVIPGFLSCAGWLSWSADYQGRVRGFGLPAPNQFPTWQVIACGVTVVLVCLAVAHLSRWALAGGLAAAVGTTAGFTAAFSVAANTDTTGQSGVGVLLSEFGWGIGLGVLMLVRGTWLTKRGSMPADSPQP